MAPVPANIEALRAQVPDYVKRMFEQHRQLTKALSANTGSPFAILSIKGKTWGVRQNGQRRDLLDENAAQPDSPLQWLDVVIVDTSPELARTFYGDKKFVDGADDPPDCSSLDSITSDPTSPNRQSVHCADCPQNRFGSRITNDGKKAKACQDLRRLVVLRTAEIGDDEPTLGPMLLRVPHMSLAKLAEYGELLDNMGVLPQTVKTLIGFDPAAAYPLLKFRGTGILDEQQIDWVMNFRNSDKVADILNRNLEQEEALAGQARAGEDPGSRPVPQPTQPVQPMQQDQPAQPAAKPTQPAGTAQRQAAAAAKASSQQPRKPAPAPAPAPTPAATGFTMDPPHPAAAPTGGNGGTGMMGFEMGGEGSPAEIQAGNVTQVTDETDFSAIWATIDEEAAS